MAHNVYKVLIFDWDGTLMDSAARIVSCLTVAIRQAELPERSAEQLRHIIGLGLNEAIDTLYPDGMDPGSRQTLLDHYRYQFIEANMTPSPLFEGVREMLHGFSRQGYLLAIATGKSRAGLDRTLRGQGLQELFPVSRCADESGSKPDPAMLREILTDYGVPASNALMVGDTEFDIEMARRALVDAVAVKHGAHDEQQLLRARPLGILEHINRLPDWLTNQQMAAV